MYSGFCVIVINDRTSIGIIKKVWKNRIEKWPPEPPGTKNEAANFGDLIAVLENHNIKSNTTSVRWIRNVPFCHVICIGTTCVALIAKLMVDRRIDCNTLVLLNIKPNFVVGLALLAHVPLELPRVGVLMQVEVEIFTRSIVFVMLACTQRCNCAKFVIGCARRYALGWLWYKIVGDIR